MVGRRLPLTRRRHPISFEGSGSFWWLQHYQVHLVHVFFPPFDSFWAAVLSAVHRVAESGFIKFENVFRLFFFESLLFRLVYRGRLIFAASLVDGISISRVSFSVVILRALHVSNPHTDVLA